MIFSATPVAVKLVKHADGEDKLPNEKNILEIAHENILRIIKVRGSKVVHVLI